MSLTIKRRLFLSCTRNLLLKNCGYLSNCIRYWKNVGIFFLDYTRNFNTKQKCFCYFIKVIKCQIFCKIVQKFHKIKSRGKLFIETYKLFCKLKFWSKNYFLKVLEKCVYNKNLSCSFSNIMLSVNTEQKKKIS